MADASFSFHDISGWIKEHPYATAGAVFVGGAVVIYLYYSSGSTPAPQASSSVAGAGYAGTGGYGSMLSAELQAEAANNAQQVSLTALQDQLQAQNNSVNGAVSIASIQSGAALAADSITAGVDMASIGAWQSVQSQGIAAGVTTTLANINSGTQLGLASIGAANFSTAVSGAEYAANVYQNMNTTDQLFNYLGNQASVQAQQNSELAGIANYAIYQRGVPPG